MPRVMLPALAFIACLGAVLVPVAPAHAATYEGRSVDDRWYEGRAVSTTFGAYRCQIKFHGDRVYFRPEGTSVQIVAFLDEEAITDPHDILARDPKRGVNWTLEVVDLKR